MFQAISIAALLCVAIAHNIVSGRHPSDPPIPAVQAAQTGLSGPPVSTGPPVDAGLPVDAGPPVDAGQTGITGQTAVAGPVAAATTQAGQASAALAALDQLIRGTDPLTQGLLDAFLQANRSMQISALQQVIRRAGAEVSGGAGGTGRPGTMLTLETSAALGYFPANDNWDYDQCTPNGPDQWAELVPATQCGGNRQSPINIVTSLVVHNRFHVVSFSDSHRSPVRGVMKNNGRAPTFYPYQSSQTLSITGVPSYEAATFNMVKLHIHFNDVRGRRGQEHSVDGEKDDAEMHFVYLNSKYINAGEARRQPDGIAVVTLFLKVGFAPDPRLSKILAAVKSIPMLGQEQSLTIGSLAFLEETTEFYTYKGSLTTPACSESVTWIIFRDPVIISAGDLVALNSMKNNLGKPMAGNIRPTQPRNERLVEANFPYQTFGAEAGDIFTPAANTATSQGAEQGTSELTGSGGSGNFNQGGTGYSQNWNTDPFGYPFVDGPVAPWDMPVEPTTTRPRRTNRSRRFMTALAVDMLRRKK